MPLNFSGRVEQGEVMRKRKEVEEGSSLIQEKVLEGVMEGNSSSCRYTTRQLTFVGHKVTQVGSGGGQPTNWGKDRYTSRILSRI